MKAAIYTQYGPPEVISIQDLEVPVPGENEVLVKVFATSVTSGDWRARSLELPAGFGVFGRLIFGLFGPRNKILGTEFAGVIDAVGAGVRHHKQGDAVFGMIGPKFGTNAQYCVVAEERAVKFDTADMSFEQAAAIPFGGTTAMDFLRVKGDLKKGERVLVVGAAGCVGSTAVQVAKHLGANVTGVTSGRNTELVTSIGADAVIDYTKTDVLESGEKYDIIIDTAGVMSFPSCARILNPGGRLLIVLGSFSQLIGLQKAPKGSGMKLISGVAAESPDDLRYLADLVKSGSYRPVIDRSYPLEDIVQAHAYVDRGRKRGSVVLTVSHEALLTE